MLKIDFDLEKFTAKMDALTRKQLPFAMTLALTWTAQNASVALQGNLRDHFTIRSSWVARGIRIEAARKKGRDRASKVGSVDPFMARQALGGTKKPIGKTKMLGVPLGIRRQKTDIMRPSRWPGKILQRKRVFVHRFGSHSDVFIYRRTSKKRYPIILLYRLTPKIKIPPSWDMYTHVRHIVREMWVINAYEALQQAIKTAR